jgi:glutaredoxin
VAFDYFDVTRDADRLKEMLGHSQGRRKVPVIVRDGQVTIGFRGA